MKLYAASCLSKDESYHQRSIESLRKSALEGT
jgi:hypothetical protein